MGTYQPDVMSCTGNAGIHVRRVGDEDRARATEKMLNVQREEGLVWPTPLETIVYLTGPLVRLAVDGTVAGRSWAEHRAAGEIADDVAGDVEMWAQGGGLMHRPVARQLRLRPAR